MRKLKVLVAGSRGQVAQALVDTAPRDTVELVALGRPHLDLTASASIVSAVNAMTPDIVINAAAYTAVDQAETDEVGAFVLNAKGAGLLAEAAAGCGAPILHLSTDYVFSGDKPEAYSEMDIVGPMTVYGRTKLAGEQAVAAANPRHIVLRTAWVYSPYGKNFVKTMLRIAETRDTLNVVDDQRGNPTSARDIADGLWRIAEQVAVDASTSASGTYHMTATGEASWAEFAREIFRLSAELGGPSAQVLPITSAEYPTPAQRPKNSRLDCKKLLRQFGVALPTWRESAADCVRHLIQNKGWAE